MSRVWIVEERTAADAYTVTVYDDAGETEARLHADLCSGRLLVGEAATS